MKGQCKHKDPQGYCELSNNASGKCKDLGWSCENYEEDEDER